MVEHFLVDFQPTIEDQGKINFCHVDNGTAFAHTNPHKHKETHTNTNVSSKKVTETRKNNRERKCYTGLTFFDGMLLGIGIVIGMALLAVYYYYQKRQRIYYYRLDDNSLLD